MANRQNTFLLKRSNTPGKIPTAGSLSLGELALNTADVILYASGTTSNSILPIGWDRIARTGDTMTGTLKGPSFSATTISATTYVGLPIDVSVTAITNSNNIITITNNTGGTISTLFNIISGLTINGNLSVTGTTTATTITATTITATTIIYGNSLKPKSGKVTAASFAGNPKTAAVTFTTPYPSTAYTITITGGDSRTLTYQNLTASGFTINANANGALSNDVHWQTMKVGEEL